jgi:hypothetical protein
LVEDSIDAVGGTDPEVGGASGKILGRVGAGSTERGNHGFLTTFPRGKLDICMGVVEIYHILESPDWTREQSAHVGAKVDLEVVSKHDGLVVGV